MSLCAAGSPFSHGGSSGGSPYHPSTSSREGSPRTPSPLHCTRSDTPELGEASEDEPHMVTSFILSSSRSVGHSAPASLKITMCVCVCLFAFLYAIFENVEKIR